MLTAGELSVITSKDFDALFSKCAETLDYHSIEGVPSPLRPNGWANMLFDGLHYDFDTLFILDGVLNGFRVVDPSADVPIYDCRHYNSCFEEGVFQKMNNVMLAELNSGRISIAAAKPSQVHALGAILKPNGAVRHITDCSRPLLTSVNNFMKHTFSTFSYNTIDNAIKDVHKYSYMATVDLQDAYRSVPIHPDDRKHFGLSWDFGKGPSYVTDNFLCFGSKCSAFIFNRLTDAIARFMNKNGFACYNYLDDFIVVADSFDKCCQAQNFLIRTLRSLGFYISWRKVTSPSQLCRFLGIDIDSVNLRLLLPNDKLFKLDKELAFWRNKNTATKVQMQRLCGVLNFCCKVIRGGRVYMFHMIELLKMFNHKRRIELPVSFKEDLSWWSSFAASFNGSADFFDPVRNSMDIYTDACLEGLAAICNNDFFQAKVYPCDDDNLLCFAMSDYAYNVFVPIEHAANINVLELIAVLLAISRWSKNLANNRLVIYCDNLQVCYNLAKDKTKNALSNACLRSIFWLCVRNNMYISPVYIPSSMNFDADYLSRAVFL